MEINFSSHGKSLVVSVKGELDQHNAAVLREQTDIRISHMNIRRLIFDFSNLEFMDSSGIGVVIGRYKLMQSVGGDVFVAEAKPHVKKILELSGIRKIVGVCETVSQALKDA